MGTAGRPTKYTPATVETILEALRKGNTRDHSAALGGISRETFCQWLNEYPEYSDSVLEAEAIAITSRVGILTDAIQAAFDEGDNATAIRGAIEFLKRKDRANWSDRTEVTGKDGAPVAVETDLRAVLAAIRAEALAGETATPE